jgi:hypothetical protein
MLVGSCKRRTEASASAKSGLAVAVLACLTVVTSLSSLSRLQAQEVLAPSSAPPTPAAPDVTAAPPETPSPLPEVAPVTGGAPPDAPAPIVAPVIEPPPVPADSLKEMMDEFHLSVGGGLILWYNQPVERPSNGGSIKNKFEVFEAKLRVDAEFGNFGVHLLPIVRDTTERGFFTGTAWVQEAYAFGKTGPVTIKVGKVFSQFGRFWDNSFYGNAQEYDGLKLDPDMGVSVEGLLAPEERAGLQFYGQYFIRDGYTNYSLPGRDTISVTNGRRQNQLVGRVEPFIKLSDMATLKLGVSGEFFQAALPDPISAEVDNHGVSRVAVDATAMVGGLTAWVEYTQQWGRQVYDYQGTGQSPNRIHYWMVGAEHTYGRFTVRYNFNQGNYNILGGYRETRHIPGIAVALDEHLFVLLEWAIEHAHVPHTGTLLGNSLNLTIHGKV